MRVLIGSDKAPSRKLSLRLLWEPRDLWIGVFWNRISGERLLGDYLLVYVCAIPLFPISIAWRYSE